MVENIKVVEINGCKFEVDLATARKVEDFRVGDAVKVLKKGYGTSYDIYSGVIVGFEWFETLPTITIAYLKMDYSECKIEFIHYNTNTKDVEISHTNNIEMLIQPSDVIGKIDKEISKKKQEISEFEEKKVYFVKNFKKYFNEFTNEKIGEMLK